MAQVDPKDPNQVTREGHAEEPQSDIQKRMDEAPKRGDATPPSLDPIADQDQPKKL